MTDRRGILRRRSRLLLAGGAAACALAITAVVAFSQLSGAADDEQPAPQSTVPTEALSQDELDKAVALARQEIESADATITSATVTLARELDAGTESNTGYRCTSDRLLQIKLIGTFPHMSTTGVPGPVEGVNPPDGEVDALLVTGDAVSGRACLRGAQDGGVVEAEPGATVLDLD